MTRRGKNAGQDEAVDARMQTDDFERRMDVIARELADIANILGPAYGAAWCDRGVRIHTPSCASVGRSTTAIGRPAAAAFKSPFSGRLKIMEHFKDNAPVEDLEWNLERKRREALIALTGMGDAVTKIGAYVLAVNPNEQHSLAVEIVRKAGARLQKVFAVVVEAPVGSKLNPSPFDAESK